MENDLRGAVMSKFPSITAFAKAVKWDRKKASRIVNHVQDPTMNDIYQMVDVLAINSSDDFVRIFWPSLPTKWGVT